MSGVNKVIVVGNLGRDPETRHTAGGASVTNVTVATSERWKDKTTGERKEETEWHRVVFFGRLAEIAEEYLRKGSKVYIEGRLQTDSWERDGQTHYTTKIVARDMQMLDSRGGGQVDARERDLGGPVPQQQHRGGQTGAPQLARQPTTSQPPQQPYDPNEDIPF